MVKKRKTAAQKMAASPAPHGRNLLGRPRTKEAMDKVVHAVHGNDPNKNKKHGMGRAVALGVLARRRHEKANMAGRPKKGKKSK